MFPTQFAIFFIALLVVTVNSSLLMSPVTVFNHVVYALNNSTRLFIYSMLAFVHECSIMFCTLVFQ